MRKKHRGLFWWLHKRRWERRHGKIEKIALLPNHKRCFHGELELALPLSMRLMKMRTDTLFFTKGSELSLIVHKSRLRRRLRSITRVELVKSFQYVTPFCTMPVIQHGFLRHSPTLRAVWNGRGTRINTLYMVQVQQTVYLLLLSGGLSEMQAYCEGMLSSVRVHPELIAQRSQNPAKNKGM